MSHRQHYNPDNRSNETVAKDIAHDLGRAAGLSAEWIESLAGYIKAALANKDYAHARALEMLGGDIREAMRRENELRPAVQHGGGA